MKIQLSEKRIVPDAITVWSHKGPEVDVVMDLKNLTFREGSITELYAFHVVDHFFPDESQEALTNWYSLLAQGASAHIIVDDFEYLARAFIGGDIGLDLFNDLHNHPCQCSRDSLATMVKKAGFKEPDTIVWMSGGPGKIEKKHYELIITGKKNA